MKKLSTFITERSYDKYLEFKYNDPIKDALYSYVSGLTSGVNDDLRKGITRGSKEVIAGLDAAFIEKSKINVYRVVTWEYLENIYGLTQSNIDDYIGKTLENKGYMSTSRKATSVWGTMTPDELMMHIVSTKPYPCIDVNSILPAEDIDCESQEEILLPRNTTVKLLSYTIKTDKTYLLEMEIQ
jgi:hypothetical protein